MTQRLRKYISTLLLLSLLLSYVPLISTASAQQNGQARVAQRHAAAIKALTEYMTGHTSWIGKILKQYEHEPAVDSSVWQSYSPYTKLIVLCEDAEVEDPGVGCDKFLALLSQQMAREYDALKWESSLGQYLSMPADGSPFIKARNLALNLSIQPEVKSLPPDVLDAIKTLASYSKRGPLNLKEMLLIILRDNPDFSGDYNFTKLTRRASRAEAITKAFMLIPEEEVYPRLRLLTSRLTDLNSTARYEAALLPFVPETVIDDPAAAIVRQRRVEPEIIPEDYDFSLAVPSSEPSLTGLVPEQPSADPYGPLMGSRDRFDPLPGPLGPSTLFGGTWTPAPQPPALSPGAIGTGSSIFAQGISGDREIRVVQPPPDVRVFTPAPRTHVRTYERLPVLSPRPTGRINTPVRIIQPARRNPPVRVNTTPVRPDLKECP
jgi:hypothetical protein